MTTLVIAEKPQLGNIIADAIGIKKRHDGYYECQDNHIVTWCIGHILELAKPESYNPDYKKWNFDDLPLKLRPLKLDVKPNTAKQFKVVEKLLNKSDTVINAGDFDDEGQLLIREVLDYCNFKGDVLRIIINDLNTEAVKKALNNLKPDSEFDGMYKKALARSQADFLFGINLSRAYTIIAKLNGVNEIFSVGRVQTPTLGLIVNRYLDNKNHKASYFYKVSGTFNFGQNDVTANLILDDAVNTVDGKIIDENLANVILEQKGKKAIIANQEIKHEKKPSPLPFSLLDLQAKMNETHGFSADKTLKITQALREKHKAITYNRSDCRYLTSEQFKDAPKTLEFLNSIFSDFSTYEIDDKKPSRAFNDDKVTAHTGIIPVSSDFTINDLTKDELVVYEAIARQYLIQFMTDKEYDVCNVFIKSDDYSFKASVTKLTNSGWSAMSSINTDTSNQDEDSIDDDSLFEYLSSLTVGQEGDCVSVKADKEKTKPLPIYTEATLLKDLQRVAKYVKDPKIKELLIAKDKGREGENGGIGTPATRSAIIKNLNDKGYFIYEGKKLIPTDKGIDFIKAMPEQIVLPDLTALWFEQQLEIEKGNLDIDSFLDDLEAFITLEVERSKNFDVEVKGEPCKACGKGVMVVKQSKNGSFIACSNYPDCKTTQSILDNKPMPDCPCCSKSTLRINTKALSCECGFIAWKNIAGKKITEAQLYSLVDKGKTNKINGFKNKAGKEFSAAVTVDKENKRTSFLF